MRGRGSTEFGNAGPANKVRLSLLLRVFNLKQTASQYCNRGSVPGIQHLHDVPKVDLYCVLAHTQLERNLFVGHGFANSGNYHPLPFGERHSCMIGNFTHKIPLFKLVQSSHLEVKLDKTTVPYNIRQRHNSLKNMELNNSKA
jgi:hypothetical protein